MPGNNTSLTLQSGFEFDYSNLYGEGKVTKGDMEALAGRLAKAHQAVAHMRAVGEVRGHLSKDGTPEKVLFSQLAYVAEGHLNSPSSISRLKEFGQSLRYKVDTVVSFGIGGSYLGNKVLFDVHCGEFWNDKNREAREGYPKLYFSGNNIDARRTAELIDHLVTEARNKAAQGQNDVYQVMLLVISKSGATLDTMSTFMVMYDALQRTERPSYIRHYVFRASQWRHFERLPRLPLGVLPIADSFCRFNPIHGQGMSSAGQQARLLQQVLRQAAAEAAPISAVQARFMAAVVNVLQTPWNMSTGADFAFPATRGDRPKNFEAMQSFEAALLRAAVVDPVVHRCLMDVAQLLLPDSALQEPEIQRRIEAASAKAAA